MNSEQFTASVRQVISDAQKVALRRHHQKMTDLHLLSALLDDEQQMAGKLLARAGTNLQSLKQGLADELDKFPVVTGSGADNLQIDAHLGRILALAEDWAKAQGDSFVALDALLAAVCQSEAKAARLLREAGLDAETLNQAIAGIRKGRTIDSDVGDEMMESLSKYTTDLTALAL